MGYRSFAALPRLLGMEEEAKRSEALAAHYEMMAQQMMQPPMPPGAPQGDPNALPPEQMPPEQMPPQAPGQIAPLGF